MVQCYTKKTTTVENQAEKDYPNERGIDLFRVGTDDLTVLSNRDENGQALQWLLPLQRNVRLVSSDAVIVIPHGPGPEWP